MIVLLVRGQHNLSLTLLAKEIEYSLSSISQSARRLFDKKKLDVSIPENYQFIFQNSHS